VLTQENPQGLGVQLQGDMPDSSGVPPISDGSNQPTQPEPVPLKIPNLNEQQKSGNLAGIVGAPGNAVLSSPPAQKSAVSGRSSVGDASRQQSIVDSGLSVGETPEQQATADKSVATGSQTVDNNYQATNPKAPGVLKTENFEVVDANASIKYFIYGLIVMTIIACLAFLYLKSWQKNRTGQAAAKYQSQVENQLKTKQFISKEQTVLNVGRQAAALQASLPGRIKFTQFLTELEKSTYKQVRFTRLAATDEGLVTLEGVANNFDDLAKAVEALKTSNNFSQVELATADKLNDGSVLFTINIALDKKSISGGNK